MVIYGSKMLSMHMIPMCNILFSVLLIAIPPVQANPLSEYEWDKRPILLFAPDHEDFQLQSFMQNIQFRHCEIKDRDIILGVLMERGVSKLNNNVISENNVSELRRYFDIKTGEFVALLIGKDGDVKYRQYMNADLDEIFALIDGMPMRRNEIQQRGLDCGNHAEKSGAKGE